MTARALGASRAFRGFAISPSALRLIAAVALTTTAAVVASRFSAGAFLALGAAVLGLLAYATYRWPRPMLVLVVLAPIIDRYLVGLLIPPALTLSTRFFSEGLLAVAVAVIGLRALRAGTLAPALRHPVLVALAAFLAVALLSMAINAVPVHIGIAGILFTIDAVALFFAVRMVGFTERQMLLAVATVVSATLLTALIGLAQAVLRPDILGLPAVVGRFGELIRIGSFIGDPGLFGALLGTAAPFALFAAYRAQRPRLRWLAAAASFVLILSLLLSFSRAGWLGMAVGFGAIALLLERRAFVLAVMLSALAYATATVMPHGLLVPEGLRADAETDILGSTVARASAIGAGRDLRTAFVLNAVPIIREHPVVGVGPGRYGGAAASIFGTPVYEEYGTDRLFWFEYQRTVDNFWLHLLVEFGMAGLLAFLAMLVAPAVALFRAARRATGERFVLVAGSLAVLCVLSITSIATMGLEGNAASFGLWFLLGLGSLLTGTPSPGDGTGRSATPGDPRTDDAARSEESSAG